MASPNPGLLSALLKSGRLTGVLRWKVDLAEDQIKIEANLSGRSGFLLNTSGAKSLSDFFAMAAKQLNLPSSDLTNFETNLVTLINSGSEIFIAWSGWQDLVGQSKADGQSIIDIFESFTEKNSTLVLVIDRSGKFDGLSELVSA